MQVTKTKALLAVGAILVLSLAIYPVLVLRLYTGDPTIAHNYLEDMNTKASAVPEEDRAWPLYREGLITLKSVFDSGEPVAFSPEEEGWQKTVDVLSRHPESIETLWQAAAKPGLGFVVGFTHDPADRELWPEGEYADNPSGRFDYKSRSLTDVLLPHLSSLRLTCKLLVADAYRAAEAGDGARASRDLTALAQTADLARETPTLISELVGISALSLACDSTTRILKDYPGLMDDDGLAALARAMSDYGDDGSVSVNIDVERAWFYDLLQRMYTDDGNGNGRFTNEGVALIESLGAAGGMPSDPSIVTFVKGSQMAMRMADREDMRNELDRILNGMIAYYGQPLWKQGSSSLQAFDIESLVANRGWSHRYALIGIMLPAFDRAAVNGQLAAMRRDGTVAAIAVNRYRQSHDGQWPASLDVLVPDFLPAVPIDQYDGQPMRYGIVDGKAVVYCLGVDCDDDGGRPPADDQRVDDWLPVELRYENSKRFIDGDWIIWMSAE